MAELFMFEEGQIKSDKQTMGYAVVDKVAPS